MVRSRVRKCIGWTAIAASCVTAATLHGQEHDAVPSGPAPVLVTVHEILKPGEEATHARLEAKYTSALNAANASQYYLGLGAITGSQQIVFMSGYSSLEEMSEVHDYDDAALSGKLDGLDIDHSKTLNKVDTAIWRLRPELSNPDPTNLAKMRYMDLIHIHVKLGHGDDFAEVIKHLKDSWMKADPDFHFTVYQQAFGNTSDNSYLVVIALKSLADLDKHHAIAADHQKGESAEIHKHLLEVEGADYNSAESNLFVFTPSISRLPESWTKDDQAFWAPKPILKAPTKKPVAAK